MKSDTKQTLYTSFVLLLLLSHIQICSCGYKQEHEGFVKNFKGTSAGNILCTLAHVPASILLLKIVQGNSQPSFIRDFSCLVLPILLNMTILADYCYLTIVLLVTSEIIYVVYFNPCRSRPGNEKINLNENEKMNYNENENLFEMNDDRKISCDVDNLENNINMDNNIDKDFLNHSHTILHSLHNSGNNSHNNDNENRSENGNENRNEILSAPTSSKCTQYLTLFKGINY